MKKAKTIVTIIILTLALNACKTRVFGIEVGFQTPTPQTLSVAIRYTQISSTSVPAVSPNPPASPLPAVGIVCFDGNIESGNLRVRECPGLTCAEVGLLTNGDQITSTGERKDSDGATWLHLSAPIDGWANSRYICRADDKP
jgi:hypothetical protein